MVSLKRCSTCKTLKDRSSFSKNVTAKDGLNNECRYCVSKRYDSKNKCVCICGKMVRVSYYSKHLETNYHKVTVIPEDMRQRMLEYSGSSTLLV
jgi:hypothetical protein